MNKPTYAAIQTHSPDKPVLVFVSSRRQTRLTGLDLISLSAADGNPRKWLSMSESALQQALKHVVDPNLRNMLSFGVGMHHAGLAAKDRMVVEKLFLEQKIQVLVCTSTLAWGVNCKNNTTTSKDNCEARAVQLVCSPLVSHCSLAVVARL